MPIKVLAYIRVSTQLQSEAGTSENQRRAIAEYAARNDLEVVDWYSDEGVSGFTMDRQGLSNLLANLDKADGVVVYDIDRLARNFELGTRLMFTLRDMGKRLYVVRTGEVFDFHSKEDQLLHVIKSWSADVVRDQIKANQKRGIERYKLLHGCWGKRPRRLSPREWKEYDELRATGVSNMRIAKYLKINRDVLRKLVKARDQAHKQASSQSMAAIQPQAQKAEQPQIQPNPEQRAQEEVRKLLEKIDHKTLERLLAMLKPDGESTRQ